MNDDLRRCPYCAEVIKMEAVKCKHCGSNLPLGASEEAPPQIPDRGDSGSSVGFLKPVIGLLIGSYALTYGLNWLVQGEPPHPTRMVTDLLREAGIPMGNIDCQSIHAKVTSAAVAFAAENDGVFIRDLVNISTESQSPTEVSCIGRATWSTGQNSRIRYSMKLRDGHYWIEFEEI